MARWLLRARDLSDEDTIPLTQEFFSQMLGVQRTSVSDVAHKLQQRGLIDYARDVFKSPIYRASGGRRASAI